MADDDNTNTNQTTDEQPARAVFTNLLNEEFQDLDNEIEEVSEGSSRAPRARRENSVPMDPRVESIETDIMTQNSSTFISTHNALAVSIIANYQTQISRRLAYSVRSDIANAWSTGLDEIRGRPRVATDDIIEYFSLSHGNIYVMAVSGGGKSTFLKGIASLMRNGTRDSGFIRLSESDADEPLPEGFNEVANTLFDAVELLHVPDIQRSTGMIYTVDSVKNVFQLEGIDASVGTGGLSNSLYGFMEHLNYAAKIRNELYFSAFNPLSLKEENANSVAKSLNGSTQGGFNIMNVDSNSRNIIISGTGMLRGFMNRKAFSFELTVPKDYSSQASLSIGSTGSNNSDRNDELAEWIQFIAERN